ncbi:ATP-grasp domain-containing protein [Planctomicrobium sp. SH527]|uniref:ATP-grasp domain-containing protein n=1 Tax=Planctomicrobium sp. SH527 TaxID=3448123 RepID=UPI003F5B356B
MNIAILGQPDGWYVKELQQVAEQRGHQATCVDFRSLCSLVMSGTATGGTEAGRTGITAGGQALHNMDAVLVRTMPPGSLEQVVYRMDALQRLEGQGVPVLNSPKAIEAAVDKFLTTSRVAAAGLPTPRTVVCETAEDAFLAFEQLGGDVVVKPIFGSEGRGILRVSDPDLAYRTFRTLERTQSVLYLQEFIAHPGFDIRVLVLNGTVLGSFVRRHPTDFRTNVARNGSAEPHEATDRERSLALQAAEAVGACFAGVDLLYDPDGRCLVIEVNAVPGWRAFEKVTGVHVAPLVIEFLEKQ